MEAAGVLDGLPYRLEWSEFPAAAPLLEALNAGAIDAGGVGDAPFTFAAAAGVPVKAFLAFRNRQDGLAILVRPDSAIRSVKDLVGKRIATNRGSIGHQVVLAALEEAGLPADGVQFRFLPPADAKLALTSGAVDAWSTWSPTPPRPNSPASSGGSRRQRHHAGPQLCGGERDRAQIEARAARRLRRPPRQGAGLGR